MIKYDPMEIFAMLTDQTRKELLNPARNDIPVPEGFTSPREGLLSGQEKRPATSKSAKSQSPL